MERLENLKTQIGILILAEIVALVMFLLSGMDLNNYLVWLLTAIHIVMIIWIIYRFEGEKESRDIDISRILGNDAKEALDFGQIGIITYNENYCATWVNDVINERGLTLVGKKLSAWIPEVNELFQGDADVVIGSDESHVYEITRKEVSLLQISEHK